MTELFDGNPPDQVSIFGPDGRPISSATAAVTAARRSEGRPTKLTPVTAGAICRRLLGNTPRGHAAEAEGVDRTTFGRWMKWGADAAACEVPDCTADHHGPAGSEVTYRMFRDMVTRAEAEALSVLMGHVTTQTVTDGRLALDLAARRHPEEFRTRTEVTDPARAGVPFTIVTETSDRPAAEEAELRAMTAPAAPAPSAARDVPVGSSVRA